MRKAMFIAWALVGATLAVGAAEKEVLRVEYENGDPGEESDRWVETYFVDDVGRLVRTTRVTEGTFDGDPREMAEARYDWTPSGVSWSGSLWSGRAEVDGDKVQISTRGTTQTYSIRQDGETASWETSSFRGRWGEDRSFDERLVTDAEYPADPTSGMTVRGASLTVWLGGREQSRLILDRRPDRLEGTFVVPYESGSGWFTTGHIVFRGSGLWTSDPIVYRATLTILDNAVWMPGWPPFFFLRHFLG